MQTFFLIIGAGRVARHLARYLELESLPYSQWSRKDSPQLLRARALEATHILLAISDGALASFIEEHPFVLERTCVHFSGSLVLASVPSAHPLQTFPHAIYDLETYRAIPFVTERGRAEFAQLLPGLSNRTFALEPTKKSLYHALCVMSGNFTTLLWEKVFREFEIELELSRELLLPYLGQVAANLASSTPEKSVLTGPLVRGDRATIERHLHELRDDPFEGVYQAFVTAYEKMHPSPQQQEVQR